MSGVVHRAVALATVLLAGGCVLSGGWRPTVTATPSGTGLTVAAREPGCAVEFHRTRSPERPYDELAGLHVEGGGDPAEAQELLRVRACQLGADAVVVTRDFAGVQGVTFMSGTAIAYRDARVERAERAERERVEQAARAERERVRKAERDAQLAAQESAREGDLAALRVAPDGYAIARAPAPVTIRSGPDRSAPSVGTLAAGAGCYASIDEARGFRRIRFPGGRAGFVESKGLELLPAPPLDPPVPARAASQPPAAPPPAARTEGSPQRM